jgi:hypothetical protein
MLGRDTWFVGYNNRKQLGEVIKMMRGEVCCLPWNEQGEALPRKQAISQGGALFPKVTNIPLLARRSRFPEKKKQNDNKKIVPLNPPFTPLSITVFLLSPC